MKITGIKCFAPVLDRSGYGTWSRGYISSLIKHSNVPITIFPPSFDSRLSEEDPVVKELEPYIGADIDYNVVVAWLTPPVAKQLLDQEPDTKFKVIHTLWETTKIPDKWVEIINTSADLCMAGGKWNEKIFLESGVTIPIDSCNYPLVPQGAVELNIKNRPFSEDTFVFYSISQWQDRKNFGELLEAYFSEFTKEDKVALFLKTHLRDGSAEEEKLLVDHIRKLKSRFVFKHGTAPVTIATSVFSHEQIIGLHMMCDCYVSTARGEGLGLGMLEAGMLGNPSITNSFGEHSSYIDYNSGFMYSHSLRPVSAVNGNAEYAADQMWAQPDIGDLMKTMRFCYNNQEEVASRGSRLKSRLEVLCNPEVVADSLVAKIAKAF